MARVHGKDLSTLSLNAQTLLADTLFLNFKASADVHDTHTLGDDWKESTPGLKGGDEVELELFYDNTVTTGTWAFLTNLLGAAATTFTFGDGTRSVSVSAIVIRLSLPINVGDMMKFTATLKLTGTVTFS